MSEEESNASEFNISIGGNVSGKQIALGQDIQQTDTSEKADGHTASEGDHDLSVAVNRATLAQLRHIFTTMFSEDELRSLTFDLAVNYDSLPGSGTAAKVRELIAYMVRQQRLKELMRLGRDERPRAPWPEEVGE